MTARDDRCVRLQDAILDVLIIGAGINGSVCAAALAAQGWSVGLVDRGDIGGCTSQASSNLIWGGIKYLENYEFGLVHKLCRSRNRLLREYPSVIREIRFLGTSRRRGFGHARHGLMTLYAGTWLYWGIGGMATQVPRRLSRDQLAAEVPIIDVSHVDGGFEYSDAYLPDTDARFVLGFAKEAIRRGAAVVNYVAATGCRRSDDVWETDLTDSVTGHTLTARSRLLINACGPYADAFNAAAHRTTTHRHVLSKGVHLIVPALHDSERVLAFFADDGRPFFVLPFNGRSCIGTTDTPVEAPEFGVSDRDRQFILDNINAQLNLAQPLTVADIIAERCGVRPLAVATTATQDTDWFSLSRYHAIDIDHREGYVSIFGGKLTDCLNIGDEICDAVSSLCSREGRSLQPWYGGEASADTQSEFQTDITTASIRDAVDEPWPDFMSRLWRLYGHDAITIVNRIAADPTLGRAIFADFPYTVAEAQYAMESEMVIELADLLRRRTPLGLVFRREELATSPLLRDACERLFGDTADSQWARYFDGAELK